MVNQNDSILCPISHSHKQTQIQAVDPDVLNLKITNSTHGLENEEKNNSTGSGDDDFSGEDPCQSVSFEQQARTYLHYELFAATYVVNDVRGLLDQKKG